MLAKEDGVALVKIVRDYSSRIRWDGKDLSDRDKLLLAEAVISRSFLLEDLANDPHCAKGYWRALMSLTTLDAKLYAESIKALRDVVIHLVSTYTLGAFGDYVRRFKPGADGIHFKWMVTPLASFERNTQDEVSVLYAAIQWASFDTKLNMRDVDFSTELSLEYLHDEYVMAKWSYDDGLVAAMRGIIAEWAAVADTSPESAPWHFQHGNGATVEVARASASPIRKCYNFRVTAGDKEYLDWRGAVEDLDWSSFVLKPIEVPETPIVVDFVPKSPLTNRVISKEHVTKMWLQKDLFWLMDDMFRHAPCHIDLHSQEKSRRMALEGSFAGRFDTFDLSKASDFVTNALVEGITLGSWLHRPLQWTRSKSAEVGVPNVRRGRLGLAPFQTEWGRPTAVVALAKFAPMGSATCFPTESLVFAVLCELAVRRTLHRKSRSEDFQVFGDDIVIRSDCSDELRFLLSLAHFKVNDGKTCRETGRHIYREACGIEAVDGKDITPFRISRRYVGVVNFVINGDKAPGETLGVVAAINRCYIAGLTNLRKFYCRCLALWPRFYEILRVDWMAYQQAEARWRAGKDAYAFLPAPFVIVDDGTATNYRVTCRRQPPGYARRGDYQVTYANVWTVCSKDKSDTQLSPNERDDAAYFLWLLQAQKWDKRSRDETDFLSFAEREVASGQSTLIWRRQWVPVT